MKKDILNATDWGAYTNELFPILDSFCSKNRDAEVNDYLMAVYGFFSFYSTNLSEKSIKNKEHFGDLSIFLLILHDNLRALISLHNFMHLASLAYIQRAVLETWFNAKFIFLDPSTRFDLFNRYSEVEKYRAHKKGNGVSLTPQEIRDIKERCPEWFTADKVKHWTGIKGYNISVVADKVGMKKRYETSYHTTSVYIHGGPNLRNVYRDNSGVTPIPATREGATLAIVTTRDCLQFLEDIYAFLGIPFPEQEKRELDYMFFKLCQKFGIVNLSGEISK
jgi:hypothetical protein